MMEKNWTKITLLFIPGTINCMCYLLAVCLSKGQCGSKRISWLNCLINIQNSITQLLSAKELMHDLSIYYLTSHDRCFSLLILKVPTGTQVANIRRLQSGIYRWSNGSWPQRTQQLHSVMIINFKGELEICGMKPTAKSNFNYRPHSFLMHGGFFL